jgi:hypothetical protein
MNSRKTAYWTRDATYRASNFAGGKAVKYPIPCNTTYFETWVSEIGVTVLCAVTL